jgi:hypothetical protein
MMQPQNIKPPFEPLPLKEVAAMLVKQYDIHEGLWEVAIEVQVGIGNFGQVPEDVLPGAMFRMSRIGLNRVPISGPLTVDAAAVNPATP